MKWAVRILSIVFVSVAVIITAYRIYDFLRVKLPAVEKRELVRHFSFSSPGDLDEWEERVLTRNRTGYGVTVLDGKDCVKAVSEDSASALFYRQPLSIDRAPFVSWDWKAEKFPSLKREETLEEKEEFDFVAQMYVIFDSRFFLNAKAIQYVWTRDLPVGTVTSSPYTENVKLMVLESGGSDEWKHEQRDIREDFRHLFGKEPEKDVAVVSFMTDSDSTGTVASAYYGDITVGYLKTIPGARSGGEKDSESK